MSAQEAVLKRSEFDSSNAVPCEGHNFAEVSNGGRVDYDRLFESFATTGFQATAFAQAVDIIREMVKETNGVGVRASVVDSLIVRRAAVVAIERRTDGRRRGRGHARSGGASARQVSHVSGLHVKHDLVRRAREHPVSRQTQTGELALVLFVIARARSRQNRSTSL